MLADLAATSKPAAPAPPSTPASAVTMRWLGWAALLVVVLVFAAKLWVAISLGLDGDEAYYTMWSAALSPGYLDHPPGVAVIIALGRAIFGDGLLGVRAVALLASLIVSAALYRTGRLLLPRSVAPALAVIGYNLCLITATNAIATPDVPSTLFWMLGVWAAAEALVSKRADWWLAVGLFAGLGLASKYTNAFFGAGLILALLATADGRAQFRAWQLWVGGLVAIAVFSPVIWWNAARDWRSFNFQGSRVASFEWLDEWQKHIGEFLTGQAILIGPILLLFFAIGTLVFLLSRRAPHRAAMALPVLSGLPVLAYFLFHSAHTTIGANWTQPALPMVTLVAAWAALELRPRFAPLRWLAMGAIGLQGVLGAALVALVVVQSLIHPLNLGNADRTAPLRDWDGVYTQIRAYAADAGVEQIWTRGGYRLAGEIFSYALFAKDPYIVRDAIADIRYEFLPPLDKAGLHWPALLVAPAGNDPPAPPLDLFATSQLLGVAERKQGDKVLGRFAIFAVSEPTPAFIAGR